MAKKKRKNQKRPAGQVSPAQRITTPSKDKSPAAKTGVALTAETVDATPSADDTQLLTESLATLTDAGFPPRRDVTFDDVVADVIAETTALAEKAVAAGVPEGQVLIDPTHDFGKNTFHGLELLRRIDEVVATGWPVLMALSNKDFIGETLDRPVGGRVAGTLAATAWAAARGVAAFRVHEVAETVDVIRMTAAMAGDVAPLNTVRGLA